MTGLALGFHGMKLYDSAVASQGDRSVQLSQLGCVLIVSAIISSCQFRLCEDCRCVRCGAMFVDKT